MTKRQFFTPEMKIKIVESSIKNGLTNTEASRKHGIPLSTIHTWFKNYKEDNPDWESLQDSDESTLEELHPKINIDQITESFPKINIDKMIKDTIGYKPALDELKQENESLKAEITSLKAMVKYLMQQCDF